MPRDDIFVTTKVWNDAHGREATLAAFDDSVANLGVDVLDLYLIHWPAPAQDRYVETWRTLLELRDAGRVRAVGVCNFGIDHLQRLADETGELPPINQIELHLAGIAQRHRATPAQVVIAWHLAQGFVVLPKSVTPSRIVENLAAREIRLSANDLVTIAELDQGFRTGPDPHAFWAAVYG